MKRLLAVAFATVLVGSALAQGTFTIRRPADGARVRETVDVRIPKNSIPEGGYLGIVVNGKFLEAVMPQVDGDDYVYKLDTKKREIPDGATTIETILYMYSNNNPVVLDRSSVTVNVDNRTSIQVPDDGFALRYKFNPGREYRYTVTTGSSISMVTQAQAQLGSRGREIQVQETDFRVLYAVDNAYNTPSGREGLVRIQILPLKGKGHLWAVRGGSAQPELIMEDQLGSLFHRISDTGREQFSSFAAYFPLEGTSGVGRSDTDWYYSFDFPVLPTKTMFPGDVWQAAFNIDTLGSTLGAADMERDKFYRTLPGRGVFEGVEWHDGIPCAKMTMSIQVGAQDLIGDGPEGNMNVNNLPGETQNIKIQQTLWFALDRGVIVRQEIDQVQEALVEVQTAGGGVGPGGPGGGPAGLGAPGGPSGRGGAGGPAGVGAPAGIGITGPVGSQLVDFSSLMPNTVSRAWNMLQSSAGGPQGGGSRGGGPPGLGGPGGPIGGPQDGGFGRGPGGAGGSVGVKVIQKVTSRIIVQLEK